VGWASCAAAWSDSPSSSAASVSRTVGKSLIRRARQLTVDRQERGGPPLPKAPHPLSRGAHTSEISLGGPTRRHDAVHSGQVLIYGPDYGSWT